MLSSMGGSPVSFPTALPRLLPAPFSTSPSTAVTNRSSILDALLVQLGVGVSLKLSSSFLLRSSTMMVPSIEVILSNMLEARRFADCAQLNFLMSICGVVGISDMMLFSAEAQNDLASRNT